MRAAAGRAGGEGGSGIPRGALCGPRSPPRGTICSLSMHHLLVWAVAGATGGGGLRSVCFSSRRGGGGGGARAGRSSAARSPEQVRRRRGPAISVAGAALAAAPRALKRHPSRLHSRRRRESRGGAESRLTQRARTATLQSTWSCVGQVRGREMGGGGCRPPALQGADPLSQSLRAQRSSERPAISGQLQWGQHHG